jgi:hypothetical protein
VIPSWLIQLVTVTSIAEGFALGWMWRGRRDRERALDELRKRGINPEDP